MRSRPQGALDWVVSASCTRWFCSTEATDGSAASLLASAAERVAE